MDNLLRYKKYFEKQLIQYNKNLADFAYTCPNQNFENIAANYSFIRDISSCKTYFDLCDFLKVDKSSLLLNHLLSFYKIGTDGYLTSKSQNLTSEFIEHNIANNGYLALILMRYNQHSQFVELLIEHLLQNLDNAEKGFELPQSLMSLATYAKYKNTNIYNNILLQYYNNLPNSDSIFHANHQVHFLAVLYDLLKNQSTNLLKNQSSILTDIIDKVHTIINIFTKFDKNVESDNLVYFEHFNENIVFFEMLTIYHKYFGLKYDYFIQSLIPIIENYTIKSGKCKLGLVQNPTNPMAEPRIDFVSHVVNANMYLSNKIGGTDNIISNIWTLILNKKFSCKFECDTLNVWNISNFQKLSIVNSQKSLANKSNMIFLTILHKDTGTVLGCMGVSLLASKNIKAAVLSALRNIINLDNRFDYNVSLEKLTYEITNIKMGQQYLVDKQQWINDLTNNKGKLAMYAQDATNFDRSAFFIPSMGNDFYPNELWEMLAKKAGGKSDNTKFYLIPADDYVDKYYKIAENNKILFSKFGGIIDNNIEQSVLLSIKQFILLNIRWIIAIIIILLLLLLLIKSEYFIAIQQKWS